jgi:hypothetical protein
MRTAARGPSLPAEHESRAALRPIRGKHTSGLPLASRGLDGFIIRVSARVPNIKSGEILRNDFSVVRNGISVVGSPFFTPQKNQKNRDSAVFARSN